MSCSTWSWTFEILILFIISSVNTADTHYFVLIPFYCTSFIGKVSMSDDFNCGYNYVYILLVNLSVQSFYMLSYLQCERKDKRQ